jgi:hypothetical protein
VRDSHNLSDSEKSSVEAVNEAVNKSPKELVDWYRSIKDDLERKRQAKTLFYGRKITVAGQPDIYVVFEDSFNFALPQFYGHVNLKDMSVEAVTNSQVFVFVCRIGRIDEKAVYGSDCRVEKY